MNQTIPQWPDWETVRKLGEGSFGSVWEIRRTMCGETERAALKHIRIPKNESEPADQTALGYDEDSIRAVYLGQMQSILKEYALMRKLNGNSNVVNCDDVQRNRCSDGFSWDILIRMELLTPLPKALPDRIPQQTVVQVGKDLCRALELCVQNKIIHRDIKPQNIFVSDSGVYKLGDFGVAKTIEMTSGGTKTGTYSFMAPEVYEGRPYGHSADIYSLGLVLYWMLNRKRLPFLPLPPQKLGPGDLERARERRLSGEPLPLPADGSEILKHIVLRACAWDPKDRWESPTALRKALEALEAMAERGEAAALEDLPAEDALPGSETGGGTGNAAGNGPENAPGDDGFTTVALLGGKTPDSAGGAEPEEDGAEDVLVRDIGSDPADDTKTELMQPTDPGTGGDAVPDGKPGEDGRGPKPRKKLLWIAALCAAAALLLLLIWHPWSRGTVSPSEIPGTTGTNATSRLQFSDVPVGVLSAGGYHTVGLRADGTAVAVGDNSVGQCDVSGWTELVAVCAGHRHTVGLRADGTVVAVGSNGYGQCNVSGWTDLVAVSAGELHTVGLRADGTAVAVGDNRYGQCDVSGWTDLVAVSAGGCYTVGLRADGTAVAVGYNEDGQCDVSAWTDLVAVSTGAYHTVGLRADGTAVAVGRKDEGQCDVSAWTDLVAISVGLHHTVGLRSDGTAVAVGYNDHGQCEVSGWTDLVAVSAGGAHTVGLRADGTAVAVGYNEDGRCNVSGWTLKTANSNSIENGGDRAAAPVTTAPVAETPETNAPETAAPITEAPHRLQFSDVPVGVLSAGGYHTVGLQADGTAVAVRANRAGKCDVSGWTDLVAVSAGAYHTVGLRADGTAVAVGVNGDGQCEVSGWTDLVAVSAGDFHTVGLRSDGTAVAVGDISYGQCRVSGCTDLVAVSAGAYHTVGLRADGTAVAVGNNKSGQSKVSGWTDLVAVSAGGLHTVGLRSDGTAVAVGNNDYGQCEVSAWTDLVAISAGTYHTVGLRADGTVVAVGRNAKGQCDVSGWTDLVAVSAGAEHTVGLRSDGTVVTVGDNEFGQCNVSGWKLKTQD